MKYLALDILSKEPLKLTSAINSTGFTDTLSFIPGSLIRGAFISNYIRKTGIKDIDKYKESKEWFFNNKLEFLNGYIKADNKRAYPMFSGVFIDVEQVECYQNEDEISGKYEIRDKIVDTDKKIPGAEYFINNSTSYSICSPGRTSNLHIKKGDKDDKKMFRYDALKEGQEFVAYIKCDISDEELGKVKDVLENGQFYLGGSKGSGYGLVSIKVKELTEINPEIIKNQGEYQNELYIFSLSDGIYQDNYGTIINHIDEEYLKSELMLEEITLVDISTDSILIGGYNNKWGIRVPQYEGNKAGALMKYTYKGTLDKELIDSVCNKGFGLRTEEGFGRFIILNKLDINSFEKYKWEKDDNSLRIKLSKDESGQLQLIVNSIAHNRIKEAIEARIVDNYKPREEKKLNINQIGKLVQLFNLAEKTNEKEGAELIEDYIHHLQESENKERENKEAYNALKDIIIDGKDSIKYINDKLNMKEDKFQENFKIANIEINDVYPDITREEMYKYKIQELENMFRYILRRENGNGTKK